ncbi:MAG: glycosyltransferase family 4 protein [Actinomycetota bacterium]|nr:glycosyltransferase family 4 protein [Actinomycetota bacterium]
MNGVAGLRIAYLCLQATTQGQASYAHVHEIISGLRRQGATVDLFEPAYARSTPPGVAGRLVEFFRVQRRLIRSLRDYDALYVRGHALAWWASKAARSRGIPVVQECNGMVEDFFIAWPAARRVRRLITRLTYAQFRDADEVIVGSSGLAGWLMRETGRTGHVIPNGANCELFRPVERPQGLPLPDRYAVFFGSLAPWQGIATALESVAEPTWPRDVSLVVIGDGVERDRVREAAVRDPRVVYLGQLPYDRVGAIVTNAVCSLVNKEQPEFAEAGISPLKLYESMACGVPVIATGGMPGLTDVVERVGSGVIVPQRDPGALAGAVSRCAEDRETATEMGRRGRAYAEEECSWYARSEQTAGVIAAAVAGRRG